MNRLALTDFLSRFSTETDCLAHLVAVRWPGGIPCADCGRITKHHPSKKRRCYDCQECGAQTYPTAGTIFHRTRTSLPTWFYVVWQLSHTRTGTSAKQIERETGVTYKTAWRMCHLVRAALADDADPGAEAALFSGTVEVDEVYMGSRKPRRPGQRKRGRGVIHGSVPKTPVVGIVERGGDGLPVRVRARVTPDVKGSTVLPFIEETVEGGSRVYTDELNIYDSLGDRGYAHDVVRHKAKEYAYDVWDEETGEVRNVHTNAIEGFWSQVKGGVLNVHRGVSPKYLQRYMDEFAFRFSHRADDRPMFLTMIDRAASAGPLSATLPASPAR